MFFPLYSWIMKFFLLFINSEEIAALLVASLCYVVGCCYFYAWIAQEHGKETAKNALIFISVFPFSFFLGAMMPESTFFMVASACLYFIKKHHWKTATLMLGLTFTLFYNLPFELIGIRVSDCLLIILGIIRGM